MKRDFVILNPYLTADWRIQEFSKVAEVRDVSIPSQEELVRQIREVHLLVADVDLQVTREVLEAAERLSTVACTATGVDYVDIPEATRRGIAVTNLPDYSVEAVAEHTLALLFCLCRNILSGAKAVLEGKWNQVRFMQGVEVEGKILGIIGLGRIGRRVAEKGQALGMKVAFYDPYVSRDAGRQKGYEKKDTLMELVKASDIVTIHAFLATETQRMFGEAEFKAMKPTAFFLNVARGGIVDEKALYRALQERWIAGAGLDVLSQEPPLEDAPLLRLDNIVVTPHLAWNTREAEDRLRSQLRQIITSVLRHEFPINVVNLDVKDHWRGAR
jgi:D-3-phosphoglycerate dehydrogenase / 2-oxoglutarate reductase